MLLFFYGPNTYAARQQISKLTAEYIKKSGSNMGVERLDGKQVKPEELRASLQATPFLANSRLVIVEGLGNNKSVAADIGKHIKDIPDTTVAVFYDPTVDQRTSYFKSLKAAAKAVKFENLDQTKLQQWISRQATERGVSIERPAISRLVELAGEDQWRLSNEIAKLALAGSPVTVDAVNLHVAESQTESVFNLVEAMTAGNIAKATGLYRELRSAGQNEVYLLSMVIWQLRNLLLAKAAGNIQGPELARAAGMSPYVAGKMLAKRGAFAEAQLKQAFLDAVDTDYQIKSGAGSPDALVEQLVYRVAGSASTAKASRPAESR